MKSSRKRRFICWKNRYIFQHLYIFSVEPIIKAHQMGAYRKITHLSCVGWPAATKGATRRNLSRLDAPLIPDRDYWLAYPAYPFPRLPNCARFEHLSCCHGGRKLSTTW